MKDIGELVSWAHVESPERRAMCRACPVQRLEKKNACECKNFVVVPVNKRIGTRERAMRGKAYRYKQGPALVGFLYHV